MKISLLVIIAFIGFQFLPAQIQIEVDTFPIYHGCKKKDSTEDLKKCFRNKLMYELRDYYLINQSEFSKELENNSTIIILFTVSKDGTVKDFSYTEDSNAIVAVKVLKKLNQIFTEYNKKGKYIKPATYKGKPVNLVVKMNLSSE